MTEPLAFTLEQWLHAIQLFRCWYIATRPADPAAIERIFAANGWPPAWRNGVHPFHHFSSAHEVLGVARGEASVLFGGPDGTVLPVAAGDVVVVPAGVAHCNQGQSSDLLIRQTGRARCRRAGPWKGSAAGQGPDRERSRALPQLWARSAWTDASSESSIRPCTPCPSGRAGAKGRRGYDHGDSMSTNREGALAFAKLLP